VEMDLLRIKVNDYDADDIDDGTMDSCEWWFGC
jgi:hypothetical protein